MTKDVEALIARFRLEPHPEGGFFREVFRSTAQVQPSDGRPPRAAVTSIYFLLSEGQQSRWHRVASDEIWHFYAGDPLELLVRATMDEEAQVVTLSGLRGGGALVHTVPAGSWQAARPLGAYSLVGCTVAPGFDYADFEMA